MTYDPFHRFLMLCSGLALMALVLITNAHAADLAAPAEMLAGPAPASHSIFTGCYIEGDAGYAAAAGETVTAGTVIDTAARGRRFGGGAGCDVEVRRLVVGIFGRYMLGAATGTGADANGTTSLSIDRKWMAAARFGVAVNPATLLYGLVGISGSIEQLRTNTAGGLASISATPTAPVIGIGLETELRPHWTIGAEYDWTRTPSQTLPFAQAVRLVGDEHVVMATLRYRFGFDPLAGGK